MDGKQFKQIRESLGLSQAELAQELGWRDSAQRKISRMESGEDEINVVLEFAMRWMEGQNK